MTTGTSVGVDDNFSTRQSAISLWTADDKSSGRVDQEFGFSVQHRRGENTADQLFHDELFNLTMGDIGRMLGGNNDGGDPNRFGLAVFDGNLGFGIGSQPWGFARFADPAEFSPEPVGEHNRSRHEFRSFPTGIAEHQSLVAGPLLGGFLA